MTPEALLRVFDKTTAESSDFDLNIGVVLPPGRKLRPAAVLIAVCDTAKGAQVILTKRSSRLKHHPGQIAFPGGKVDEGDADAEAAALREAQEEVGLIPGNVKVLGRLSMHETVTGYSVIPILGHVRDVFIPIPEAGEVEEVFSVPLPFLMNTANYRVEKRLWRGDWRRYYAVPYGPYYIWGATARILRGMAERLVP
ncbi:MAG: 8-oxo-dGTP pyrophosphatase MutT (NUDIX family) [Pseudorhodobacter sp.]|jgi:8-oxo-dGTP pyrophosphatase MutT (NUDIX family)